MKKFLEKFRRTKINRQMDMFMEKIREDNPDATWANLLAGIAIIVLVAILSVNFFSRDMVSKNEVMEEIMDAGEELENGVVMNEDNTPVTTVQSGEGLWNVAERVCGNGEAYNILANANGLTIYSSVSVGQELKVVCE